MENERLKQTKFDSMVTNRQMQLVKAVIPYIDNRLGIFIGMFVKLQELQNALKINSNMAVSAMNADKQVDKGQMENLLDDIKEFLSNEDRETIDNISSMMEMMKTMNDMDMGGDAMQGFMDSMNMEDDVINVFMNSMNMGDMSDIMNMLGM